MTARDDRLVALEKRCDDLEFRVDALTAIASVLVAESTGVKQWVDDQGVLHTVFSGAYAGSE